MKKNIVFVLLFLLPFLGISQHVPFTQMNGLISIQTSAGSYPNYTITGVFSNSTGEYEAGDVLVGDYIYARYVLGATSQLASFEITSVSAVGQTLTLDVTDVSVTATAFFPPGIHAISRNTPVRDFPLLAPGLSDDLAWSMVNDFILQADSITSGGGSDTNYFNTDLTATGNRTHSYNNTTLIETWVNGPFENTMVASPNFYIHSLEGGQNSTAFSQFSAGLTYAWSSTINTNQSSMGIGQNESYIQYGDGSINNRFAATLSGLQLDGEISASLYGIGTFADTDDEFILSVDVLGNMQEMDSSALASFVGLNNFVSSLWAIDTSGINYQPGNVGIGTVSDSLKRLHVLGSTRTALFESDNLRNIIELRNSGTIGTYAGMDLIVNSTSESGIDSYMDFVIGTGGVGLPTTEALRIDTLGAFKFSKYTDALSFADTDDVAILSHDATGNIQQLDSSALASFVGLDDFSTSLWFDDGASTYLIDSTDNVGIGTTTPTSLLHVQGNAVASIKLDPTNQRSIINSTSQSANQIIFSNPQADWSTTYSNSKLPNGVGVLADYSNHYVSLGNVRGVGGTRSFTGHPLGGFTWGYFNPGSEITDTLFYITGAGELSAYKYGAGTFNDTDDSFVYSGDANGNFQEMTFTELSDSLGVYGLGSLWSTNGTDVWRASGNVGIGTINPLTPLDIDMNGSTMSRLVNSSGTVSYLQFQNATTGIANNTGTGLTVGLNNLNAYIYNRELGSLYFGTDDKVRMQILNNGNIYTYLDDGATTGMTWDAANGELGIGGSPSRELDIIKAKAGTVTARVSNLESSNSIASALLELSTNGSASGDPYINFNIAGATDWYMGVDNNTDDRFKLGVGSFGSSPFITLNKVGEIGINKVPSSGFVIDAAPPAAHGAYSTYQYKGNVGIFVYYNDYLLFSDASTTYDRRLTDGNFQWRDAVNDTKMQLSTVNGNFTLYDYAAGDESTGSTAIAGIDDAGTFKRMSYAELGDSINSSGSGSLWEDLGTALAPLDGEGLLLDNATYIQWKDNGGTPYSALRLSSGNDLVMASPDEIRFQTDATERFRIEGNGDLVTYKDDGITQAQFFDASSGNSGFGTGVTIPTATVDIRQPATVLLNLNRTGSTTAARVDYGNSDLTYWRTGWAATYWGIADHTSGEGVLFARNDFDLGTKTALTVGHGNVPEARFHLRGATDNTTLKAFLVENGGLDDVFEVRDDGNVLSTYSINESDPSYTHAQNILSTSANAADRTNQSLNLTNTLNVYGSFNHSTTINQRNFTDINMAGSATNIYGLQNSSRIFGSGSPSISNIYGVQSAVNTFATGSPVITSFRLFDATSAPGTNVSTTIQNLTYYNTTSSGSGSYNVSNSYELYLGANDGATNSYGVYQAHSTRNNYFAGNVGIGVDPIVPLDIESDVATAVQITTTHPSAQIAFNSLGNTGSPSYLRQNGDNFGILADGSLNMQIDVLGRTTFSRTNAGYAATATLGVKGEGTTSATIAFNIRDGANVEIFKVWDNGLVTIADLPSFTTTDGQGLVTFNSGGGLYGIGYDALADSLSISDLSGLNEDELLFADASGNIEQSSRLKYDVATGGVVVRASTYGDAFRVRDDSNTTTLAGITYEGKLSFGGAHIFGSTGSGSPDDVHTGNAKTLSIRNFTSTLWYPDGLVNIALNGTNTFNGTSAQLKLIGDITASSANHNFHYLSINPTVNQSGTAGGNIIGLYLNPTLTAVTGEYYSIFSESGDAVFMGSNVGINESNPSYPLHVSGQIWNDLTGNDRFTINSTDANDAEFSYFTAPNAEGGVAGLLFAVEDDLVTANKSLVTVSASANGGFGGLTLQPFGGNILIGDKTDVPTAGFQFVDANSNGFVIESVFGNNEVEFNPASAEMLTMGPDAVTTTFSYNRDIKLGLSRGDANNRVELRYQNSTNIGMWLGNGVSAPTEFIRLNDGIVLGSNSLDVIRLSTNGNTYYNIPLASSNGIELNTNDENYSIWSNSNLNKSYFSYGVVGTQEGLYVDQFGGGVTRQDANVSFKIVSNGIDKTSTLLFANSANRGEIVLENTSNDLLIRSLNGATPDNLRLHYDTGEVSMEYYTPGNEKAATGMTGFDDTGLITRVDYQSLADTLGDYGIGGGSSYFIDDADGIRTDSAVGFGGVSDNNYAARFYGQVRFNGLIVQDLSNNSYISHASGTGDLFLRNNISGRSIVNSAKDAGGSFSTYSYLGGLSKEFRIVTNSQTYSFVVDSMQRVGINADAISGYQAYISSDAGNTAGLLIDIEEAQSSGLNIRNSSNLSVIELETNSDAALVNLNNAAGTNKVRLRANGDSYFDGGSVGVGITSPLYKLHVSGTSGTVGVAATGLTTANEVAFYGAGNVTGNAYLFDGNWTVSSNLSGRIKNDGTGGANLIINSAAGAGDAFVSLGIPTVLDYSIGIDNSDSDKLKITNGNSPGGGTNLMTITSTGQVGIGQTAPSAKLEIIGVGLTSSTLGLKIKDSASADLFKVYDNGLVQISKLTTTTNSDGVISHHANGNLFSTSYQALADTLTNYGLGSGGGSDNYVTANLTATADRTQNWNSYDLTENFTSGIRTITANNLGDNELTQRLFAGNNIATYARKALTDSLSRDTFSYYMNNSLFWDDIDTMKISRGISAFDIMAYNSTEYVNLNLKSDSLYALVSSATDTALFVMQPDTISMAVDSATIINTTIQTKDHTIFDSPIATASNIDVSISANAAPLNPAGWPKASVISVTATTTGLEIDGIESDGVAPGQILIIYNAGGNSIGLDDNSSGIDSDDRLMLSAYTDITMPANASATFMWHPTISRWALIGKNW